MTKLTIIGAGSAVFTKNIVSDLLSIDAFKNIEIALQDINPTRLKASHDLLKVISEKLNTSPKITSHTNRRESLAGSDFVQTTIQVGGYKPSTVIDFEIPNKYGLKQTIADTIGIGGIMRGLRTIPVLLDIAKDISEVCPKAIWLQYVNPMCTNMIAIKKLFPEMSEPKFFQQVAYRATVPFNKVDAAFTKEEINLYLGSGCHFSFLPASIKIIGKPSFL